MVTCCSKARTCPISVRWYRSILPCDCDEYAGDCLTLMLAPRFCATVFKRFRMNSSWSVCSVVGESVACARPHSNMNVCRHRTRYCCCWFLSCTRTAIAIPDSTSIAVSTGSTCLSPKAFMYVKSTCITGCLLVCFG